MVTSATRTKPSLTHATADTPSTMTVAAIAISSRGGGTSAVVPSARSIHREAAGQVAINAVLHGELRPSHIMLPVIDR